VPRSPPGLEDRGRTRCGSPCDRQEGRGRGRRGVDGRRIRNEGRARRGDLTAALPRAGDDDRQGTQPRRRQRPPLSISRTRHRTDTIELTRDPMLRVAVPNKGALSEAATDMLGEAGYSTRRGSKTLVHQDEVNGVEFFYLRHRDIAIYVGSGILDAGITGRDLLLESQTTAQEVLGLGFGASRFFYAGTMGTLTSPDELASPRIATSLPNLVAYDLAARGIDATTLQLDATIEVLIQIGVANLLAHVLVARGIDATTVQLDGAIEVSIQLGVADAVADVVETGSTLRAAGLETFGPPLLESEGVLIQRADAQGRIDVLKRRLESVMV